MSVDLHEKRTQTSILSELPDDATHDDIVAMAKQLVSETTDEASAKAGDDGDDSVVEPGAGADETAKTTAGDGHSAAEDAAAQNKDGEDAATKESTEPDWLDDDLKAVAATLGISDEQLSGFANRDELDRAMSLLDAVALNAGRKATEKTGDDTGQEESRAKTPEPSTPPSRDDKGRYVPKSEGKESSANYQVQLDPEVFSEEIINEFNQLRDHYESRLSQFEGRFAQLELADRQRDAKAAEERFDAIVDSLGDDVLFGESGHETKEQLANRKKLFDEHNVYLTGLKVLGREVKTDKSLVDRVAKMTFAEHFSKQQRKQLTKKITSQSRMRMGSGVSKPTDPPEDIYSKAERLYRELSRD